MHYEVLGVAISRCLADANITSLVSTKIYNYVPKDTVAPPYLRVQWLDVEDIGDKGEDLVSGTLRFDFWTEEKGDKTCLQMVNYLRDEFHRQPLNLTLGSTNLLLTQKNYTTFLEGDGLSRHAVIDFHLIIEA